jgi:hypothetical protein
MGKAKTAARQNGARNHKGKPYDRVAAPAAPAAPKNNLFKMNKDLGQHILKNPGIAQAIVDKADLKQSDVGFPILGRKSLSLAFLSSLDLSLFLFYFLNFSFFSPVSFLSPFFRYYCFLHFVRPARS